MEDHGFEFERDDAAEVAVVEVVFKGFVVG